MRNTGRIPHLAAGFKSSRLIDQAHQRVGNFC